MKITPEKFKPLKKLGQHFLTNRRVLDKMFEAADLTKDDTVIEIGPGLGFLTFALAKKAKKVLAVEKDKRLTQILSATLEKQNIENVEVVKGDVLNFQFSILKQKKSPNRLSVSDYKMISNLPYNIASAVIMKFLTAKNPPGVMVILLQKEVAQRICAKPPHLRPSGFGGQAKMNKLAVFCQILSKPKIICYVSKNNFWPKPKVDSAIIRLVPTSSAKIPKNLAHLVNTGFSQPRKQLINNLAKLFNNNKQKTKQWLLKNDIKPEQRPETLAVENWLYLAKNYRKR